MPENSTRTISVRVDSELKRQVDIALAEEQRSLQDLISELLINWLKERKDKKADLPTS